MSRPVFSRQRIRSQVSIPVQNVSEDTGITADNGEENGSHLILGTIASV